MADPSAFAAGLQFNPGAAFVRGQESSRRGRQIDQQLGFEAQRLGIAKEQAKLESAAFSQKMATAQKFQEWMDSLMGERARNDPEGFADEINARLQGPVQQFAGPQFQPPSAPPGQLPGLGGGAFIQGDELAGPVQQGGPQLGAFRLPPDADFLRGDELSSQLAGLGVAPEFSHILQSALQEEGSALSVAKEAREQSRIDSESIVQETLARDLIRAELPNLVPAPLLRKLSKEQIDKLIDQIIQSGGAASVLPGGQSQSAVGNQSFPQVFEPQEINRPRSQDDVARFFASQPFVPNVP